MTSNLPEIRVYSPSDRENGSDKSNVFSWHTPKFEVTSSYPVKNESQQLRFFSTNNRGVNIYFKSEKVNSDISDSLQTVGLVKWENTFNMRSYNLNNFPTSTTSYRTAYRSQAVAMQRARLGFITGTAKSLEILRQNMQSFINKEIDDIIQKYIEKFFKPGIENIKVNNGENSVSDQHLHSVCRQILEEAKKMYQSTSNRGTSPADFVELESSSSSEQKPSNNSNFLKTLIKKRKESDTDSEASFIPVKPKKRKGRPPNVVSGRSTPFKIEQVRREGPKWDPNRLTSDTQFIMGAKANKALGLGATRGRLYIKHPDVFKYSGDQEDKQWLYDHNLMPATGGKAYMLLVEDIKELAESEEYRNNPALMTDEIVGFTVPENMITKMKQVMLDMRTDMPTKKRGRPPASNSDGNHDNKLEDFASDDKQESRTVSPTDDLDLLGSDMRSTDPSPFSLGTGFEDVSPAQPEISPAPSDLSATFDPPLSAPFDIGPTP
ncbi:Deoxynucleotidyltransferase terminal-interacting protein 1 [Araneus ventricosus]|uniref:Deoxynucleotidyltransferase terminal-interacting protein 1 n=1 Tax=Araneus ventricosus TaxID=182803 RepID=A0A4Y2SQJ0_ARAVE|nr:Deoxynucleotidyltransferase terminal-interacting protein 1 [Araneus ventricosus]GBN76346.1 Deoxynucleotidyltransferase terminal-interacting protein 1 [Araneus ventricosus]GBN90598.1 Deoxynucleotidyltransferase terminal-interacting protein 1 [Araneus ventricosus]GBN90987.1 Deoxynucleotidyltransferase terminal-interacting protein 1 [Araneus ventricosus]